MLGSKKLPPLLGGTCRSSSACEEGSWLLQDQRKSWLSLELSWSKPRFLAQFWRWADLALGFCFTVRWSDTLDSRSGVHKLQSFGTSWPVACCVNKVLLKHMQVICLCAAHGSSSRRSRAESLAIQEIFTLWLLKNNCWLLLCQNLGWTHILDSIWNPPQGKWKPWCYPLLHQALPFWYVSDTNVLWDCIFGGLFEWAGYHGG